MSGLRNPVFWLTWGLPLVAVVASFLSLGLALRHPDGELPEQYHWEGFQLDRDFSRGERATELHVRAHVIGPGLANICTLELSMSGEAPAVLNLSLSHATLPALDQHIVLRRQAHTVHESRGEPATYEGSCHAVPDGHWRLELGDALGTWAVRGTLAGSLDSTMLNAGLTGND